MSQYIDKAALVEEIERRINSWTIISEHSPEGQGKDTCTSRITELNDLFSFIDTLEVKEVDLDKELEDWLGERIGKWTGKECERMCRHFFELGMQQSNNDNNNEEKS